MKLICLCCKNEFEQYASTSLDNSKEYCISCSQSKAGLLEEMQRVIETYSTDKIKIWIKEGRKELAKELIEYIADMYHKIGKCKVWRNEGDVICDLCEEYFKKKLEAELK